MSLSKEEFKLYHSPGFKGLWKNYGLKTLWRGLLIPLLFSLGVSFLIFLSHPEGKDIEDLVLRIKDQSITIIPSLLGFLLGGYTFLIGFGNVDTLKTMTEPRGDSKTSYFQNTSSIFAFCILAQALTLLLAFFYEIASHIHLEKIDSLSSISKYYTSINSIGFFIILLSLSYSIFLLPNMVLNVFNFSQVYHQKLAIQRIKDKRKEDQQKNS
jgi:hypothetical protein